MCHSHIPSEWSRKKEDEAEDVSEHPSLSERESADDVEILTDGGDE
ncbi:hypothetical protein ABNG02_16040 [Halorubrum ejinorense]|uniref:Uncharacterized protein n=1 Tax=Halorubrum ejinorense TaxID=425309 RepID=A0AAV3SSM8_9EURY